MNYLGQWGNFYLWLYYYEYISIKRARLCVCEWKEERALSLIYYFIYFYLNEWNWMKIPRSESLFVIFGGKCTYLFLTLALNFSYNLRQPVILKSIVIGSCCDTKIGRHEKIRHSEYFCYNKYVLLNINMVSTQKFILVSFSLFLDPLYVATSDCTSLLQKRKIFCKILI